MINMGNQLSSDLRSLQLPKTKRANGRPWWVWIVALLVIGGGIAYGVRSGFFQKLLPAPSLEVEATTVAGGARSTSSPGSVQLTASGYVVPLKQVSVATVVAGRISTVRVQKWDEVQKGDVIVEFDPASLDRALSRAKARTVAAAAAVNVAAAELETANVKLKRDLALLRSGALTESAVEDRRTEIKVLQARLGRARADVMASRADEKIAEASVREANVVAPASGTVTDIKVTEGATVDANTKLVELADLTDMVVEVDVPEGRSSMIQVGGPCVISLEAVPGKKFKGSVLERGRMVDRTKAALPVRIKFDEPLDHPAAQMAARVDFIEASDAGAAPSVADKSTRVPAASVVKRAGEEGVFVVEGDGRAVFHAIRVSERDGDEIKLASGPAAGVRIVRAPPPELESGQVVSVARQ